MELILRIPKGLGRSTVWHQSPGISIETIDSSRWFWEIFRCYATAP